MFTLTTEETMWGTVQHFETRNSELANCLYEVSLEAGCDSEIGKDNGLHFVDMYADDELFTGLIQAAQAMEMGQLMPMAA